MKCAINFNTTIRSAKYLFIRQLWIQFTVITWQWYQGAFCDKDYNQEWQWEGITSDECKDNCVALEGCTGFVYIDEGSVCSGKTAQCDVSELQLIDGKSEYMLQRGNRTCTCLLFSYLYQSIRYSKCKVMYTVVKLF